VGLQGEDDAIRFLEEFWRMIRPGKTLFLAGALIALGLIGGEARATFVIEETATPGALQSSGGNGSAVGSSILLLADTAPSFNPSAGTLSGPHPTTFALMGVGGLLLLAPFLRRKTRLLGRSHLD
jgi:hypothetical protein